jgi:iron complex outermembrane receptor protein
VSAQGRQRFIVNGRLAWPTSIWARRRQADRLGWARNLLNEQHMFYKAFSQYLGTYGFFNEARTYGLEANVKF